MKSQILTVFSLVGLFSLGVGQAADTAPAGAAAAPVQVQPVRPTQPMQPVTPPNPTQPNQPVPPSGPSGTQLPIITNGAQSVPRFNTNQTGNPFSNGSNQVISSNGTFARNTNQTSIGTNPVTFGTNPFASGTNPFAFGTNLLTTNRLVRDEAATPEDRVLVFQIRRQLLPTIRRERVPIHLIAQNGVVTLVGF